MCDKRNWLFFYVIFCLCVLNATEVFAKEGFQLNRFEPTMPGEWSFMIDNPWYSRTRYFAIGTTLNYAHNPLMVGFIDNRDDRYRTLQALIAHQVITHIDIAGSFLDRVTIGASVPVVFLEQGGFASSHTPAAQQGMSVGDPRLSLSVRLFGQPYRDPVSVSLMAQVFIPLRKFNSSLPILSSDQEVRVLPKIAVSGLYQKLLWSLTAGFLYRDVATLGYQDSSLSLNNELASVGSEVRLGLSLQYFDSQKHFSLGPEVLLSTLVSGQSLATQFNTNLELLAGGHYHLLQQVQLSLAVGTGLLRTAGTPDFRLLARVAYAPERPSALPQDRDQDGIEDDKDACVQVPGVPHSDPHLHGCPKKPLDQDSDGVPDDQDQCKTVSAGKNEDPMRRGCPKVALPDRDHDTVIDQEDRCPDVPQGPHPDRNLKGCPALDSDRDGVYDEDDFCPTEPSGPYPDKKQPGCPQSDKDQDHIPDLEDACPTQPGAPNKNPKKHGCPGLVIVKNDRIVILAPVYFAHNKDGILPKSYLVLQAVADTLTLEKHIKRIRVEGHTDNRGRASYNLDLSKRRAANVRQWLIMHGVDKNRIDSEGYGSLKPILDNRTENGRAKNRRVEFVIINETD